MVYPRSILFVAGNVFFERFAFSGLKAVLTLYATSTLQFSQANATALFNGFSVIVFFSAVFGSILADGYIGKFHTIVWVTVAYAIGSVILTGAAVDQQAAVHPYLDIIALILTGLACGMVRPCVPAFGGDQFEKGTKLELERFFLLFYFAVNAGNTLANYINPMFRAMSCNGQDTCFPLAFGFPALLITASLICFTMGTRWYKKKPPQENIIVETVKIIAHAITNKRKWDIERKHLVEHYLDDHECFYDAKCKAAGYCQKVQLVKDIQLVLRLLIMYIPIPIYYALYEQLGSRWVIQGAQMNGRLGSFTLLPDQIGTVNPLLVVIFVPFFSYVLYPLLNKCVKLTPLRKMIAGGIFAAAAFAVCGILQLAVNTTLPIVPDHSRLSISNYAPCDVNLSLLYGNKSSSVSTHLIPSNSTYSIDLEVGDYNYTIGANSSSYCPFGTVSGTFCTKTQKAYYGTIAQVNTTILQSRIAEGTLEKAIKGQGEFIINVNYFLPDFNDTSFNHYNVNICQMNDSIANQWATCLTKKNVNIFASPVDPLTLATAFVTMKPGIWHVWLVLPSGEKLYYCNFTIYDQGGIYTMTLLGVNTLDDIRDLKGLYNIYTIAQPNTISLMWQVPQYVLIACAEILFTISGTEFSYSQAPKSMKSILQAIWLIAVAIGNVIVIIVATSQAFSNRAYEFFLFAGIMAAVILIFAALSHFYYEYITLDSKTEEPETQTTEL